MPQSRRRHVSDVVPKNSSADGGAPKRSRLGGSGNCCTDNVCTERLRNEENAGGDENAQAGSTSSSKKMARAASGIVRRAWFVQQVNDSTVAGAEGFPNHTLVLNNYKRQPEVLGTGTFSTVFAARVISKVNIPGADNGMPVAVKEMPLSRRGTADVADIEIKALAACASQRGVINLFYVDIIEQAQGQASPGDEQGDPPAPEQILRLVLELCHSDDLYCTIQRHGPLEPAVARQRTVELADTIQWLHDNNIAHLDIKLENLAMARDNKTLKLLDFGHALLWGSRHGYADFDSSNWANSLAPTTLDCADQAPPPNSSPLCMRLSGTERYRAPEVQMTEHNHGCDPGSDSAPSAPHSGSKSNQESTQARRYCYDARVADTWSLAVLFFELRRGYPPYERHCTSKSDPRFDAYFCAMAGNQWARIWRNHDKIKPRNSIPQAQYTLTSSEKRVFEQSFRMEAHRRPTLHEFRTKVAALDAATSDAEKNRAMQAPST